MELVLLFHEDMEKNKNNLCATAKHQISQF